MSEPLVLSFKSDVSDARNAIANLASTVVTNMMTIGSAMKVANDNVGKLQSGMAALPTVLRTAAASFIAFEAVKFSLEAIAKAAEAAQEKLAEIVKVGNDARNAGVGTNFFQQWAAQADQLATSAEKLTAMLQRARDAATVNLGTGGNANASQMQNLLGQHVAAGNIGQGDVDIFNGAQNQEARIRAILDLVDRLMASGKQLAALNIGQAMFGKDFENQLRNGVDIVQKMRDAMASTKDVAFPPDVIARAQEINKQLEDAERKMREGWLPVQQDILRWQQDELASLAQMKDLIGDIAVLLGGWYTSIKNAGNALSDMINNSGPVKALADWTKSLPEGIFGRMPGVQILTDADRQRMIDERDHPHQLPDLTVPVGDRSKPLPSKATASSSTDEVETYINNLRKSVEVLKAENETYGKSNTEKAEAVNLRNAEAAAIKRKEPLSEKEISDVKQLSQEQGKAKDTSEQLQKATERANSAASFLGEQVIGAFEKIGQHGVKAKDIVLDFAKALEKAVLQAALLGEGGLFGPKGLVSGLFGGLFTPASSHSEGGFAGFGPQVMVPTAAFANAKHFATGGGIPAILHPGEIVLNQAQQGNVAKGLGGVTLNHAPVYNINGTGLSAEQLSVVLEQHTKREHRQIGNVLANWQKRYGT